MLLISAFGPTNDISIWITIVTKLVYPLIVVALSMILCVASKMVANITCLPRNFLHFEHPCQTSMCTTPHKQKNKQSRAENEHCKVQTNERKRYYNDIIHRDGCCGRVL